MNVGANVGNSIRFRIAAAVIWLCVFCIWFYRFGLPNNQPTFDAYIFGTSPHEPHAQRWMAWSQIPFNLLDLVDPPVEQNGAPWSWLNLTQRLPFIGIAIFVWGSAIAIGRLALRGLKLIDSIDSAERFFVAGCLGLAAVSLAMLGLGLVGAMSRWPLLLILAATAILEACLTRRDVASHSASKDSSPRLAHPPAHKNDLRFFRLNWIVPCVATPFVICMLLGAMSPQVDFDVIEYHLGGPKEWFLQGHIARLPHNVYTSFPFLTEMLLLTGMVIYGDWEWGALAGQAIIAGFAPLTAIGLFATGRRWFTTNAGWLAALVWLTTPWVYRISIIAYAEGGLACYLFAAFAMGLRFIWFAPVEATPSNPDDKHPADSVNTAQNSAWSIPFVSGILSGCAMSCKYTGLVSVVLPVGFLIVLTIGRQKSLPERARALMLMGSLFSAGVLLSVGPWLLKNLIETGNPVFPLAYAIFRGEGRDAAMAAQWNAGHSRHYPNLIALLIDLPVKLTDVAANNDWHSALMFGLAPVALMASWRKKVWLVWAIIGWQFISWFLLTHQIDRFYVPMFPVVALLAGCGGSWLIASSRTGAWIGGSMIALSIVFNAWMMEQQGFSGFNAGRLDLQAAGKIVVSPALEWMNAAYASNRLPPETKVLCVGEAALFHAKFPYVYNTVFDRSLFEQWFAVKTESGQFRLKPPDQIRATLREHGITHVLVNWSEILRYREPGSYGYTDFAHPDRLQELQQAGILGSPLPLPDRASFVSVSESKRNQIKDWAPRLGISVADQPGCRSVQVFPVNR